MAASPTSCLRVPLFQLNHSGQEAAAAAQVSGHARLASTASQAGEKITIPANKELECSQQELPDRSKRQETDQGLCDSKDKTCCITLLAKLAATALAIITGSAVVISQTDTSNKFLTPQSKLSHWLPRGGGVMSQGDNSSRWPLRAAAAWEGYQPFSFLTMQHQGVLLHLPHPQPSPDLPLPS